MGKLKTNPHNGLIRCKDYDNFMMYPSTFVTKLTTLSENVLGPELNSRNWLCKKFYFDYISLKVMNVYVSLHGDDFKELHSHAFELAKKIISTYICIRLKHHAKEENRRIKKHKIRSKLSKLILFSGE